MKRIAQWLLIFGLILIGLIIAAFFGTRSLRAVEVYEEHGAPPLLLDATQPSETDAELIRDWMTIPYISITYDLPPNLLYEALDIPPRGNEEKSLSQLNEKFYPESPGVVIEIVKATVRAHVPPPTPAVP